MKKILILTGLLLFAFCSLYATGTLTITKSSSVTNPIAGQTFTYTLQYICYGNCYGVQVVDTLPTGYTSVTSTPKGIKTGSVVSWLGGDSAGSMTNSASTITMWGFIPAYTAANTTNTAECFGTQGGNATGTTILVMATSTATTVSTATKTFTLTPTITPTFNSRQLAALHATQTSVVLRATQTAVEAKKTATAAATQTAGQATIVALTATANKTPNMVNTEIAATKTAVKTNAIATVNAKLTATATFALGYKTKATQTAVALHATQTATTIVRETATAAARESATAAYWLTNTKTSTPTITRTSTNTPTYTVTRTITPTFTATHDPNTPWTISSSTSTNVFQGTYYVNGVQAYAWSTTSTSVTFYNATSPTGCVAGNALLTLQPSGVVTNPVSLYSGIMQPDGTIRGLKFTNGLYVSGTAAGASLMIQFTSGKIGQ